MTKKAAQNSEQKKIRAENEELGRLLKKIFESGYPSNRKFLLMNFLRGIVTGVGGVIGATVIIALLLWLLSFFDSVPLVGPLIDNVQDSIESR